MLPSLHVTNYQMSCEEKRIDLMISDNDGYQVEDDPEKSLESISSTR